MSHTCFCTRWHTLTRLKPAHPLIIGYLNNNTTYIWVTKTPSYNPIRPSSIRRPISRPRVHGNLAIPCYIIIIPGNPRRRKEKDGNKRKRGGGGGVAEKPPPPPEEELYLCPRGGASSPRTPPPRRSPPRPRLAHPHPHPPKNTPPPPPRAALSPSRLMDWLLFFVGFFIYLFLGCRGWELRGGAGSMEGGGARNGSTTGAARTGGSGGDAAGGGGGGSAGNGKPLPPCCVKARAAAPESEAKCHATVVSGWFTEPRSRGGMWRCCFLILDDDDRCVMPYFGWWWCSFVWILVCAGKTSKVQYYNNPMWPGIFHMLLCS